jgi:hypothetical protein
MQGSEIFISANLDLLHQFAMRILSISSAMGLDERDEQLLWEYLATDDPGSQAADRESIGKLLKRDGESEAVLLKELHYVLSMDIRFDKRPAWKRCLRPLTRKGVLPINQVFMPDTEEGRVYLEEILNNLKSDCFAEWYPFLRSIPRENGVDWNPPETSDIKSAARFVIKTLLPGGMSELTWNAGQATNEIVIC